MTDDNTDSMCLFFDEQGNGPSEIKLFRNDIRELSDGGKVISPRAFGLRWRTTGLLHFVEDGGFMLEERTVTWLRDALTAWLDAPRLAARKTPTVVAERQARDGTGIVKLVRSADYDEWAVISPRGGLYAGWRGGGEGRREAFGVLEIVSKKESAK